MASLRTGLVDVLLNPCDGPLSDGHIAVFLALALANQQHAPVEREVVEFQRNDLHAAYAGRVQHLHHRAVAQPDSIVDIAELEDLLDLPSGQDVSGQRLAQPGQLQFGCRIVQQMVPPRHPPEPHPQGNQARVLRTEAHRFAVLLAVEEQIPLIAFEDGPRDLDRIGDAPLLAPPDERDKMELAIADRVLGVVLDGEGAQVLPHHDLQRTRGRHSLFAWRDDTGHCFYLLRLWLRRSGAFSAPRICVFPASNAGTHRTCMNTGEEWLSSTPTPRRLGADLAPT